jgi:tRNA (cmo5U34)-methyltransferase
MTQWEWNPDTYLDEMLTEIAAYPELQERATAATAGLVVRDMLELGIGTGETARRMVALHPDARLVAIDSSPEMLERARAAFPNADLRLGRLEDPLPEGQFDLVYSALVVHHLDGAGKHDLFRRVADVLREEGVFVLADVVVPEDPADVFTPIDWEMDLPDRADDQLDWLRDAGFDAQLAWSYKDLAVIRSTLPKRPG